MTNEFWQNHPVVVLTGAAYPLLFCSQFLKKMEQKGLLVSKPLVLLPSTIDVSEFESRLSQTFLGSSVCYWLGEITGRLDKKMTRMLEILSTYTGPHQVLLFLPTETKVPNNFWNKRSEPACIMLPDTVDRSDFEALAAFVGQAPVVHNQLLDDLFAVTSTLPLDTACMMNEYLLLISAGQRDQFRALLPQVIEPSRSLYSLASAYFARDSKSLYETWHDISQQYPDMFWLVFWSEQFWQAYHAITFLRQHDFAKARKVGYRLPIAFTKYAWKQFTPHELKAAYQFLYTADYRLKRGSSFAVFDLLYSNHFTGVFAKQS